jgi:hypothetical protein
VGKTSKLDRAVVDVGRVSSLVQSVILLVRLIAQMIRESKGNAGEVAAELDAAAPDLARAAIANTTADGDPETMEAELAEAEPAPEVEPEPKPEPKKRGRRKRS